jgi:sugar transferase (PEP-CTERM/EpsH1 system associated)
VKVLFLANRTPYPPFRGDKLKIYNLLKRLSSDFEIYLIAFAENKKDLSYKKHLLPYCKEVHLVYQPKWRSVLACIPAIFSGQSFQLAYFRSKKMHRCLNELLLRHPDLKVIHTQHLRMSQYTSALNHYRILDLPDAYSLYWERRKKVMRPWLNRIFDNIESKRVIQAEKVLHQFNLTLACSVEDRDHLRNLHEHSRIELLRNGVDLETFNFKGHDYNRSGTLLFTGNMDYAPNVDAVTYFVKEMFGSIKRQYKGEIKLVIAGQRPVAEVKALAAADVIVTGFVPDISELYEQADVVIAPLRFGAGTQNKVLEAMAMGVPVVCTDIGFKGLEIESGEGCLYAPDDEHFIAHTLELLNRHDLREKTGLAGLEVARKRFSWEGIADQLKTYLLEGKVE